MTKSEFLRKLSIGEARVINKISPETNMYNPNLSFDDCATPESLRAWAHAIDLGIFVGSTEDHHQNPVIIAMRETRCGHSIYKQMVFAEAAWEYYLERQKERT